MRLKLYKSSKYNMISGVCGGIAEFLTIEPLIIRAIFTALLFIQPFTAFVYIALAMAMPEVNKAYQFGATHNCKRKNYALIPKIIVSFLIICTFIIAISLTFHLKIQIIEIVLALLLALGIVLLFSGIWLDKVHDIDRTAKIVGGSVLAFGSFYKLTQILGISAITTDTIVDSFNFISPLVFLGVFIMLMFPKKSVLTTVTVLLSFLVIFISLYSELFQNIV